MLWVKSSQRGNSPRINRFRQENRGRERKRFGRRQMRFGEQNHTTLSLCPPLWLCISLLNISLHLFCSSLSPQTHSFSLSIHLPLVQALIYDCMQCASFSEIGWICISYCAIIRAWPQLSVTWTSQTQHSVVFHLTCFQMIFRVGVQTAARNCNMSVYLSIYLGNHSFIHFWNASSYGRWCYSRCSYTD